MSTPCNCFGCQLAGIMQSELSRAEHDREMAISVLAAALGRLTEMDVICVQSDKLPELVTFLSAMRKDSYVVH